jgi:hypothetical protein
MKLIFFPNLKNRALTQNIVKDKPFGILIHDGVGSNRDFSKDEQRKKKTTKILETAG